MLVPAFRGPGAGAVAVAGPSAALRLPAVEDGVREGFPHAMEGVRDAVHVADLVAVVRRDRDLFDAESLLDEFDDDLRIEVPVVRQPPERELLQGAHRIRTVSAVELGEAGADQRVL